MIPAEQRPTDIDPALPTAIVLTLLSFLLGLWGAVLTWPVIWLPWQVPIVWLLLVLLPAFVVLDNQRQAGMTGEAARVHERRRRRGILAVCGLLLVVLPAEQWQARSDQAGLMTGAFVIPVGLAVLLSLGGASMAESLSAAWLQLRAQPWEQADTIGRPIWAGEAERGGRVNRTAVMRRAWQWWVAGGLLMAVVDAASSMEAGRHTVAHAAWDAGLLLLYTLLGLLTLGRAMQMRWATQWQLDHLPVATDVAGRWQPYAVSAVFAALVIALVATALPIIGLGHAMILWGEAQVLLPLAEWVLRFWQPSGNGSPAQQAIERQIRRMLTSPPPTRVRAVPPSNAEPGLLVWLGHAWPTLAAFVLVVAIGSAFVGRWRGGAPRVPLARRMKFALMALWLAVRSLWQPVQRAVSHLTQQMQDVARQRQERQALLVRQGMLGLYLRFLDQMARRGHPRAAAQTPHAYARSVAQDAPTAAEPLIELADLFAAVRYGHEPLTPSRTDSLRVLVKAVLSRVR